MALTPEQRRERNRQACQAYYARNKETLLAKASERRPVIDLPRAWINNQFRALDWTQEERDAFPLPERCPLEGVRIDYKAHWITGRDPPDSAPALRHVDPERQGIHNAPCADPLTPQTARVLSFRACRRLDDEHNRRVAQERHLTPDERMVRAFARLNPDN